MHDGNEKIKMSEIYIKLAGAVVRMQAAEVIRLSQEVLEAGLPPEEAIEFGLAAGMNEVGRLFSCKEYFVPEVLVCARAMYGGFDILKDKVVAGNMPNKGKVVIGVVSGDFHDIGKNIVKLMLEAAGFQPIDLGKNVPLEKYLETCAAEKPSLAALSTLMTTTMEDMGEIVKTIKEKFPEIKVMVGGAPVSQDYANAIGADFYGEDAKAAVDGALQMIN